MSRGKRGCFYFSPPPLSLSFSGTFSLAHSFSLSLAFRARHGDAAIQSQLGLFIYRTRSESSMSKGLPRLPLGAGEPLFARIGVYAKTFQPQARFTPRIYISCFFRHLIVRGLKCTSFLYLTLSHFFLSSSSCVGSRKIPLSREITNS